MMESRGQKGGLGEQIWMLCSCIRGSVSFVLYEENSSFTSEYYLELSADIKSECSCTGQRVVCV